MFSKLSYILVVYLLLNLALYAKNNPLYNAQKIHDTNDILTISKYFQTPQEKVNFLNNITLQLNDANLYFWTANTALDIATQIEYKKGIADANKNIGNYYGIERKYMKASQYFLKALNIYMQLKDTIGMGRIYNNIGNCCWELAGNVLAEQYFLKAQKFIQKSNDKEIILRTDINIAMCYLNKLQREGLNEKNKPQFDSARKYVHTARKFIKNNQEQVSNALTYNTFYYMAYCHYISENYRTALDYLDTAISYALHTQNYDAQHFVNKIYFSMAKCYLKLNDINLSQKYLEKSIEINIDQDIIYNSYIMLSKIYKTTNQKAKEIEALYNALAMNDSIHYFIAGNREILYDVINDVNSFQNNLLQEDNIRHEKQIKTLKTVLVAICFAIILIAVYMVIYHKKKQGVYKEIQIENEKLTAQNITLKELNHTKNKFFSIIAHDLRNPINILLNFTKILLSSHDKIDKKTQLEIVTDINLTTEHLSKLLENLLNWARTQSNTIEVSPEILYPMELANTTYYLMKLNLEAKDIKVEFDISPQLLVYADMNLITTILRNLVSNAIKFTPRNGIITIAAEEVKKIELPKDIQANTIDDKVVLFAIKDTGIGMPDDLKNNLFKVGKNKSSDGTEQEKGTGLGLVICAEFVEKNGGKIWVESVSGEGSTFYFTAKAVNENMLENF